VRGPAESAMRPACITLSIVSHDHHAPVKALVDQLVQMHGGLLAHVIVTHNLKSSALNMRTGHMPFQLTEIFNDTPLGFGANHNRAFQRCLTPYFCVLNPDLVLDDDSLWEQLLQKLAADRVGAAYPVLLGLDGAVQDSERELVTPVSLLRRHVLHTNDRQIDWVSAAFLMFSSTAWRDVGGFDERYHMYCEDVDLCLRLQLRGWRLAKAPSRVVHVGARNSRRQLRHTAWHVRSLLRLWASQAFFTYRFRRTL
jgi:N-acetylglucosaminyl-diphospho-decaprenol L-rhamnosyltransferase